MKQAELSRRQLLKVGMTVPFIVTYSALSSLSQAMPPVENTASGNHSNENNSGREKAPTALFDASDPISRTVFDLSVASGDPSASGVILWTRLNPAYLNPTSSLAFEVAQDKAFERSLLKGFIAAHELSPQRDYCVRIDLQGKLAAGTQYWYRFYYSGVSSPIGRCKTLPNSTEDVQRLKIATLNCQEHSHGYYGGYRFLAEEENIDFVLHLGDFIYERVVGHNLLAHPLDDRIISLPSGAQLAMGVEDYRHLYRSYRKDPYMQAAMEAHTFVYIPDDHDVTNNAYWDYERDTLGAQEHPYNDIRRYPDSVARLTQLMMDARKTWVEYMPARVKVDWTAKHPHQFITLYRSLVIGKLAEIHLTDGRSYRTRHSCQRSIMDTDCEYFFDPALTLLGAKQRQWLLDKLASHQSHWNILASQTYLGRIAVGLNSHPLGMLNVDAWDGFQHERALIGDALHKIGKRNFIALSGDMHSCIVSYVKRNYEIRCNSDWSNTVGVEFMTPPLSSAATIDLMSSSLYNNSNSRRWLAKSLEQILEWTNAHIEYFNGRQHGYSVLELSSEKAVWRAYGVDVRVKAEAAVKTVLTKFEYGLSEGKLKQLV